MTERAVLAGGCFWGMQDLIRRMPGVISTPLDRCTACGGLWLDGHERRFLAVDGRVGERQSVWIWPTDVEALDWLAQQLGEEGPSVDGGLTAALRRVTELLQQQNTQAPPQ